MKIINANLVINDSNSYAHVGVQTPSLQPLDLMINVSEYPDLEKAVDRVRHQLELAADEHHKKLFTPIEEAVPVN